MTQNQKIAWGLLVDECRKNKVEPENISQEEYLLQAKAILTVWGLDYTKDMDINDSHFSCIMNPNFEYSAFIGKSIYSIALFVAGIKKVKIKFKE